MKFSSQIYLHAGFMCKGLCNQTPSQYQTFLLLLRNVHKLYRISFCWEGPHVLLTLNLLQINCICWPTNNFYTPPAYKISLTT